MSLDTRDLFGETEGTGPVTQGPQYHDAPFYHTLLDCCACAIRAEATKVVPGVGPQSAEFIFLGRNPGINEDKMGIPFIGKGGDELDRMLSALEIDRTKVLITNVNKCHTMGDRPPKPIEISACTTMWLGKELEFFNKVSIVFPMGREAVSTMLGPDAQSPGKREGYWVKLSFGDRILHVCPLNHPGYLLRTPSMQGQMYNNTLPAVKKHLLTHFRETYERSRQA